MKYKHLYILIILLIFSFSCNTQKNSVVVNKTYDIELFTFSPDSPIKLEIEDGIFKTRKLICLEYEEFIYIYEYVSNEVFDKTPDNYKELQNTGNCKESEVNIASSKMYQDESAQIIELQFQLNDTSDLVSTYQVLKEHEYFYELIPIGLDIELLNKNLNTLDDYVSFIYFTKRQLIEIENWTSIEEIGDDKILILKNYFETNQEAIKSQIKKEVKYSSHPYRIPEAMHITAKALILNKINPFATNKRYRTLNKRLK